MDRRLSLVKGSAPQSGAGPVTVNRRTRTAIVGGGHGCKEILEFLHEGRLSAFNMEVVCVCDPNPDAVGVQFARELGIATKTSLQAVLGIENLETVIELTGSYDVLAELYRGVPHGVEVVAHGFARLFWDLSRADQDLRERLEEKIQLEAQLERDSKRLQAIMNSLDDVIVVMDADLVVEAVNAGFNRVTGMRSEEVVGQTCQGLLCGKAGAGGKNRNRCPVKDVVLHETSSRAIHMVPAGNGGEAHYEVSATPLFDEQGRIVRIVETFHRITEQVMLKRETKEAINRFQRFLDSAHDLITIKDRQGRYQVINPSAAALFQRSAQDFIGKTDEELFDPGLSALFSSKDREVLEQKRHVCYEETLAVEGKRHHLNTVRFPLLDYKGDLKGVCSISRDITEQRGLQRSLIQSEKLAALGKLAAGVAHEINTPLTGILTFVEDLLMDVDPGDPMRRDLEVIEREGLRCRRIVKDLLEYAKQQKPVRRSMNINTVVARVHSMISKQAGFRNIDFRLDLPQDIRRAHIDGGQIQQVVLNLVMNAADAMEGRGSVRVQTGNAESASHVFLAVEDSGCGIPKKDLQRVFEPFYSTKGRKGNGLGLPVVLSIVEQHGGRLDIETEEGKGTRFTMTLPACREGEAEPGSSLPGGTGDEPG